MARAHNDANVLCVGGGSSAWAGARWWRAACSQPLEGGRAPRRVDKTISALDR